MLDAPLVTVLRWCRVFRLEISSRLQQVLLLDLPLSHEKAVEQMLWKSVFYHVIEVLRQELSEFDEEHIRQQLVSVIDHVISIVFILLLKICNVTWDISFSSFIYIYIYIYI